MMSYVFRQCGNERLCKSTCVKLNPSISSAKANAIAAPLAIGLRNATLAYDFDVWCRDPCLSNRAFPHCAVDLGSFQGTSGYASGGPPGMERGLPGMKQGTSRYDFGCI